MRRCVKGGYQCDYGIRLNWDGRRSKRPQLKAIRLDAAPLMQGKSQGQGQGDDDDDGDGEVDGDGIGDGFSSPGGDTATTDEPPSSTRSRFQFGSAASPPSTASSVFTTSATSNKTQHLTFMPVQVPAPQPSASPSRPTKASSSAATFSPFSAESSFRVMAPMAAPSKASAKASGPRTPLPVSASLPNTQPHPAPYTVDSVFSTDAADTQRHPTKRQRIDSDASERDFAWTWPLSPSTGSGSRSTSSPRQLGFSATLPATGSAADVSSPRTPLDESQGLAASHASSTLLHLQAANDFRRLSVSSLLSGPVDPYSAADTPPSSSTPPVSAQALLQAADLSLHEATSINHGQHDHHHSTLYYGIDAGFRDLDLGKNDDANALSGVRNVSGSSKHTAFDYDANHAQGDYYRRPVAVRIPRALGVLPAKLMDNPMNLLYFHHFINNTARVLVPHDDPRSNPFRTILPQMALNNDNLLSLLLAYSASHRASALNQTPPAMRIALWVQDIFPALRQALHDPQKKISNANVATAIMLASLAIVSPTAFGYNIPWQKHLMLARELIATRPEGLRVDHHSSLEGQVCSFLWSWFAYLDVLGGLSGGPTDASPAWILDYKVYNPQDDDEIDCIMGFTTRCIYILSQIAELVRQCEPDRLRITRKDPDAWIPSMHVVMRVESLEVDVRDSMQQTPRPCAHLHRSGDIVRWDRNEMAATNDAYHWAALVHLHRRVLGKPSEHADVQGPVQEVIQCLDRVRIGGTAENCLLFPLFTAGCECIHESQRHNLLNRMRSIEGTAMMQVTRARLLMQETWKTGKPWETLLTSEFIG
ncbi:c6 zinc finger domain containing protein [Niveomyces insectorum RCEF 264]|uniref:C6 zinc finger domain containing protein n=1 Tax=Niveomyces insectorum RCEF 264 TaxID=1081102 RepID=A0A167VK63_9HYPO|nr:c6 zinc finger domain containing protein [Niveomyces insectorum RCEF 264]